MKTKRKLPLSVVMITLNEEYNLPGAIESIEDHVEEIFILDSGSTDRTVDIALEHGITILQNEFQGFGEQWNVALESFPIKSRWTMKMDPDERWSKELTESFHKKLVLSDDVHGYTVRCRIWFMGHPLAVRTMSLLRVWRTGKGVFPKVNVNEHLSVEGTIEALHGTLEHLDARDLHAWLDKQNTYTTLEALHRYEESELSVLANLFGSNLERRMWLKKWFYHLPFRYTLFYYYCLVGTGAWRSGKVGRCWARMRTEVMRLIEYKYLEAIQQNRKPSVPHSKHTYKVDPRIAKTELQRTLQQKQELKTAK